MGLQRLPPAYKYKVGNINYSDHSLRNEASASCIRLSYDRESEFFEKDTGLHKNLSTVAKFIVGPRATKGQALGRTSSFHVAG